MENSTRYKFCLICNKAFYPKSKRFKFCSKECVLIKSREHQKKYRDKNKEVTSSRNKKYNKENPTKIKSNHYRARYGITLEKAEELLKSQNNLCAICGKGLDFHGGTKGRDAPCVDHCHTTGKIRGMICTNCNLILGYCYDKTFILLSAITYLEKQN